MLWGAFGNAASAMQAMSVDLGTISQNVANINTTGYKTADTLFETQLSEQIAAPTSRGTQTNPNMTVGSGTSIFGVGTYTRNLITVQVSGVTTGNGNDLEINGGGFFIVAPPAKGSAPTTTNLASSTGAYYTRDGAFQEQGWEPDPAKPSDPLNAQEGKAYYVTSGGDYLMGWMADPTTGIVNTSTLTPVYTQPTATMPAVATTAATLAANIPADASATQSPQTSTASVTENNSQQTLSLQWTRVNATTWTVSPTGVSGGTLNSAGNAAANTYTVTTDGSGGVVSVTDSSGTSYSATNVPFAVNWTDGTTTAAAVNLGPLAPTMTTENTSIPIYDAASGSHNLVLGFEKTGADTWTVHFDSPDLHAPQTSTTAVTDAAGNSVNLGLTWTSSGGNTWTVTPSSVSGKDTAAGSATVTIENGAITSIDGAAAPPATTTDFTVATATGATNKPTIDLGGALPTFPTITTQPVTMTFSGDGQLASVNGQAVTAGTPATISVSANWSDGQSTTTSIDVSKLTQFTSNGGDTIDVAAMSQNGYQSGNLQSTSFDSNGVLTGSFTNGETRTLFQVPLATFVAPDSLAPISGNLYQVTAGSGAPTVGAVDQVGGGGTTVTSGSLESSTVNLQDQMTDMILAQKAYSINSQVFQTSDKMTQTARDLQT